MKKKFVLRVRMPDDMNIQLKQAAIKSGTTVSRLIRKLIETNLLTKA
jgi:predicted DNA-binding protein